MSGEPPSDSDSDADSSDPVAADATSSPDSPSAASAPPEELPLDLVFSLLSNSRRRLILERLRECDDGATLSGLASHVAAVENEKPESELTSKERKRVYISLYQNHLPRMEDVDVVSESEEGIFTPGSNMADIVEFLEAPEDSSRSWSAYYAANTGLSTAALLAGYLLAESVVPLLFALSLVGYAAIVGTHLWSEAD